MDEANNLSVIFKATPEPENATEAPVKRPPLKDASTNRQLQEWIRNCNKRIATLKEQIGARDDEQPDSRNELLALFPKNLHFPIGALYDFANRLGKFENLALADKVGLETQAITSGILYLQQHIEKGTLSSLKDQERPLAYSRNESEATWTCFRDVIKHCSRNQSYNITLESDHDTYLPIPTLDVRLIIQNVIFSVLNGSFTAEPIAIHVSNIASRPAGTNSFCLAIKVPGNPLGSVISSTYYSARKSNNTFVFEGSGIGHIIAAKLIEFLGGDIIITNNCDSTNTVKIIIPLNSKNQREEAPAPDSQPRKADSVGDFSVLYIEDMKSHALLVKQIFERLSNINLLLAATGWAGLEAAQRDKPDLILLDMELPDMKGIELYRRLQQDPRTAGITVFAISASAMPHQVNEALDLGIRHYITKPFSYKELIQMLLEEQAARKRLQAP
jgi:CheY-like chemotaxis protein